MTINKEKWTEDEILALSSDEHNYLERKGSGFLTDSDFQEKLAKAICALANSYGGHLIIGIEKDGTVTGVPRIHKGTQSTREYLEQKIPLLLVPVLQAFAVHEVIPNASSIIPFDRVIIVIDVYDSNLAPHQTNFTKQYFYRAGSHSVNAPHLYLEGLRNRQFFPGERVVEVWFRTVFNPLIEFLELTQQTLEKREWRFYQGEDPDDDLISLGYIHLIHKKTFQHDRSLQFLSKGNKKHVLAYYPEISKAGVEYDDSLKKLNKACQTLFSELCKNPNLKSLFSSLAVPENILPLITDKILLKKFFKNFRPAFEEYFSESRVLKEFAFLILNREPMEISDNLKLRFWNQHRSKFLALLNDVSAKAFYESVLVAEKEVLFKLEKLLALLEFKRRVLSEKYGVPFYDN